jgi:hypothetical protein
VAPRLHHSDEIDPTLLAWILDVIDAILGWSPLAIVLVLAALVAAIPLVVTTLVLLRRRPGGAAGRREAGGGPTAGQVPRESASPPGRGTAGPAR